MGWPQEKCSINFELSLNKFAEKNGGKMLFYWSANCNKWYWLAQWGIQHVAKAGKAQPWPVLLMWAYKKLHPVLERQWHGVAVLFFSTFPVILSLLFCWWSIGSALHTPTQDTFSNPTNRNRHTAVIKFSFLCQTGLEIRRQIKRW